MQQEQHRVVQACVAAAGARHSSGTCCAMLALCPSFCAACARQCLAVAEGNRLICSAVPASWQLLARRLAAELLRKSWYRETRQQDLEWVLLYKHGLPDHLTPPFPLTQAQAISGNTVRVD